MNAEKKSRDGGSQPENGEVSAHGRLYALLELSLGNQLVARAAVAHALTLAGRDTLPEHGPELLAFVRAHLVNILTGELGPRLTIALLDDLAEELDPGSIDLANELPRSSEPAPSTTPPFSGPREVGGAASSKPAPSTQSTPSSRPLGARMRVLMVDPDRIGRTTLARAVVRGHSNVTVIDSVAELDGCLLGGETFDIALVDAHHMAADAILYTLASRLPLVAVVARSGDASATEALLKRYGFLRFEVRSRDAPAEELVVAMKRTLAAP